MTKYLEQIAESDEYTTKGKRYEVIREDEHCYHINGDSVPDIRYTKLPDKDGHSYATWFKIVEEALVIDNIAVLADETLGGIQREYAEVKRAAAVGERIKVVNAAYSSGEYSNGDVLTVSRVWEAGGGVDVSEFKRDLWNSEYVVLAPTNVVRIDEERYRLVERSLASVGDRVIITKNNELFPHEPFKVGEVVTVTRVSDCGHINGLKEYSFGVSVGHYSVLEPVETAEPAKSDTSVLIAQITATFADTFAKVSARLTQIERDIDAIKAKEIAGKDAPIPGSAAVILTRDEVIERAKADVAELTRIVSGTGWVDAGIPEFERCGPLLFKFVVNRAKRTVVALGELKYFQDGEIEARGKSRCAPGDVFNSHIGRAISLRRALGLEVPEEYTNAPQPESVRVGDIVNGLEGAYIPNSTGPITEVNGRDIYYHSPQSTRDDGLVFDYVSCVEVIDDSREGGAR